MGKSTKHTNTVFMHSNCFKNYLTKCKFNEFSPSFYTIFLAYELFLLTAIIAYLFLKGSLSYQMKFILSCFLKTFFFKYVLFLKGFFVFLLQSILTGDKGSHWANTLSIILNLKPE